MNETERNALHEWVAAGNCVHENTCNAEDGHGNYIDFLDVYREEQDIRDTLSILSDEDKEEYLAELRGEDTIKSLKKRLDELLYKTDVYEKVLQRHNLIEEAETLMEEGRALSRAFDKWAEAEMGKLPRRTVMVKIKDRNLPELAEIYNSGGKDALYQKLRESFGIKYPWSTLDRMKNIDYLGYNEATDRFCAAQCEKAGESLFMSIDELCSPVKPQHICEDKTERNAPKAEAMEKLVKELIGDRLLELSRYVVMDTISKTMIIDKTALIEAGYTLVTH